MYKTEDIDTNKFLKALDEKERNIVLTTNKKIEKAKNYQNGYTEALWEVRNMFECKNYEKEEK